MRDSAPTVSVIIPTYNRAGQIDRAVRQVIAQDFRPIELIAVNDGSEDNTAEVLDGLRSEAEGKGVALIVVNKQNGGVSSARNAGLRVATGELIAFLDDDDTWFEGKLTQQVQNLQETGADACFCIFEEVTRNGVGMMPKDAAHLPETGKPGKFLTGEHAAHINSLVVSRVAAGRTGEFDEELRQYEDIEWITRLLCIASVANVDAALGRYEYTPGSLFHFIGLESLLGRDESNERMLLRVRERCGNEATWQDGPWRVRAERDFDLFVKHRLYAGDLDGARAAYKRAQDLLGDGVLRKAKRKMRKAWWLSLIGKRIRHPKFAAGEVISG